MILKKHEGELPKKRVYNSLTREFDSFMSMNCKIAEVSFATGEYSNVWVARGTLQLSAKRHGYPIRVSVREGKVYMIRTDM